MWIRAVVVVVGLGACTGQSAVTTTTTTPTVVAEPSCLELRDNLIAAKQERTHQGLGDRTGIARVDDAARAARHAGCNVDDLIGPNVGRPG